MSILSSGPSWRHALIVLSWSAMLLSACGGDGSDDQSTGHNAAPPVSSVNIPVQTDDGWIPASLAEVGLTEQPLGIDHFEWPQYAHNSMYIVGDILLRPRDMAKFGQMILQGGSWFGQQVVPEAWIQIATAEHISVAHAGYKGFQGYGFFWWRKNFQIGSTTVPAICADGFAGQAIMVFPALDMVVVVTGGNYDTPEREHDLIVNHVLRSAIG